jgi:hypothetical protein
MVTSNRRSPTKKNEGCQEETYDPLRTVRKARYCGRPKRARGVHASTRVGYREPAVTVRVEKIGKVPVVTAMGKR